MSQQLQLRVARDLGDAWRRQAADDRRRRQLAAASPVTGPDRPAVGVVGATGHLVRRLASLAGRPTPAAR